MELKPEHQPKEESLFEWLVRDHKNKFGDAVRSQYRVEEWTDGYDQDDYYVEGRNRMRDCSVWFDTKERAEELLSKSRPSSNLYGAYLKIGKRTLYRKWIEPKEGYWKETWL